MAFSFPARGSASGKALEAPSRNRDANTVRSLHNLSPLKLLKNTYTRVFLPIANGNSVLLNVKQLGLTCISNKKGCSLEARLTLMDVIKCKFSICTSMCPTMCLFRFEVTFPWEGFLRNIITNTVGLAFLLNCTYSIICVFYGATTSEVIGARNEWVMMIMMANDIRGW